MNKKNSTQLVFNPPVDGRKLKLELNKIPQFDANQRAAVMLNPLLDKK